VEQQSGYRSRQIALVAGTGKPTWGELVDVHDGGAGIDFFPRDKAPTLPLGQAVDLNFPGTRLETPVRLSAVPRYRKDFQDVRHYGFKFLSQEQIEQQIDGSLYQFLNRRRAFRCSPVSRVTFLVEPDPPSEPVTVELVNISATGLAFRVDLNDDRRLAMAKQFGFRLDMCHAPNRLNGTARHSVLLVDEKVQYGCEFNSEQEHFERVQDSVVAYIMQCQRRRLEKGRNSNWKRHKKGR